MNIFTQINPIYFLKLNDPPDKGLMPQGTRPTNCKAGLPQQRPCFHQEEHPGGANYEV